MNECIYLEEAVSKFQIQNSIPSDLNSLVIWKLRFGICLEFGYCDLGFPPDSLSFMQN